MENHKESDSRSIEEMLIGFHGHMQSSYELANSVGGIAFPPDALDMSDYIRFLKAFLNVTELMSDKVLQQKLDFIDQDSYLKLNFPDSINLDDEEFDEISLLIAPVPLNDLSTRFDALDQENGMYVRNLLLAYPESRSGLTLGGFGNYPSAIHRMLPIEIQRAGRFVIPKYASSGNMPTVTERENIKELYKNAFKKLKTLLNDQFRLCQKVEFTLN